MDDIAELFASLAAAQTQQVAQRLINVEEHQYSLAGDTQPYQAACQSRFNNPEIIAVLGDMVRRMRLLKGTRAAISHRP